MTNRTLTNLSLLLVASIAAIGLAPSAPKADPAAIDMLMARFDKPDVAGASVIVIQGSKIVYSHAYGMANLEENIAATTGTNYRLASVTKEFTAMAILMLAQDGKLTLDDSLRSFFPRLPAADASIHIRHLLNHVSGIWDYEDLIPKDQTEQVSDQDVLSLLEKKDAVYFEPGAQFKYSNSGFVLLGLVVEKVAGMPFAQFLKQRIFEPIGMKNSVAYERGISEVPNRAYGYTQKGDRFDRTDQSVTSATLGDGGIYTSVIDMYKWDQALNTNKLVSRQLLQEAWTPGVLNDGKQTKYGFGWYLDPYRGRPRQYHTGETVGFNNVILRFPKQHLTVILLANRTEAEPLKTAEKIADLFLH